jgi:hypothetical protein
MREDCWRYQQAPEPLESLFHDWKSFFGSDLPRLDDCPSERGSAKVEGLARSCGLSGLTSFHVHGNISVMSITPQSFKEDARLESLIRVWGIQEV